jgi:hypothetical protein
MNRALASFLGGLLLAATSSTADRVNLTDMGFSVWVPSGWQLQNVETTDTFREYRLEDTTLLSDASGLRHSGVISLRAYSGAMTGYPGSTDPTQWILDDAEAWSIYLSTTPLSGQLIIDDTTAMSGLFARTVYGWSLQAEGDSVLADYVQVTGSGDVGWEFWIESDTTDMDSSAIPTYLPILDSIQLNTATTVLPPTGIGPHRFSGATSQALSAVGGALRIRASQQPQVEVMDLMGRTLRGSLSGKGDGIWSWRPLHARPGTILVRVHADGSILARRLVLDP